MFKFEELYMTSMNPPPPAESNSTSSFKSLSKGISLFIVGVGCLVLTGWALDIAVLKSILPGLASMKSNTALLFVLCGVSLWMQIKGQTRRIAQACAFIVVFVGVLTLGEYLFNGDFGIDQVLFRDKALDALYPGRISPATALCFILIGPVLIFLDNQSRNWFNMSLVIAVFVISMLALIGYIYGVSSLYQIGAYSSMALHTALSFILLSIAILFARPERGLMQTILADTAGGNILRRLLPVVLVGPILLGWIRLWGQRAGLYDTAFGLAIMVISIITTLTIIIWLTAAQLTTIDIKRRQMNDSLHASELRFRSTLESMIEGCQIIGYDWRYLYLNDSAIKHGQQTRDQMLGHTMMECYPGIENTSVFSTLRRCMEERTSHYMINEFIYPDGAKGSFEFSVQPAPDGIFILSTDITKHKRAEEALLEREMKLTTLFEILPVGISILDEERKVSYTNTALKKILDISEEGLLKGTYRNRKYLRRDGTLLPIDEMASARAFKEKREIDGVETGVVKEDNSIVWTNISAVPVDFPDWKVVMVTSDITDRKQAEMALSRERELLRTLVDNMPEEVYVKDRERRFLLANELVVRALGAQSMDEIIGKRDEDFMPPDVAKQFADEEDQIMRTGKPLVNDEYIPPYKPGPKRWFMRTKLPLRDGAGNIIGLAGLGSDITERKQAEEEILKLNADLEEKVVERTATLTQANALLQTMIDHIPDHIFFKDVEGRFIRNSKSQAKMLGLSDPAQVTGKTDFDFFPHAQRSFDEEQEVIRSGQPLIGMEEMVVWPDGHETWFSTTKMPLRDQNGQIIGTFGIGRDITDRKYAEDELQKVKDELEIKVTERTAELREANEQLQLELHERKQAEREILKLNAGLDRKVIERTNELATANKQLHELLIVDELTGLYNRRGFLLHAEQQLLLARRAKYNLLVFYADLDGLKQINDHFGHSAGDEAIVTAARTLNETFRTSDIKARLGGDEFIVLAMEAEEYGAQILLARLRKRLAENNQSMSVGVITFDAKKAISVDDLIARADQAMYAEKLKKPGRREM